MTVMRAKMDERIKQTLIEGVFVGLRGAVAKKFKNVAGLGMRPSKRNRQTKMELVSIGWRSMVRLPN